MYHHDQFVSFQSNHFTSDFDQTVDQRASDKPSENELEVSSEVSSEFWLFQTTTNVIQVPNKYYFLILRVAAANLVKIYSSYLTVGLDTMSYFWSMVAK